MRGHVVVSLLLLLTLGIFTGCQITQSGFARTANNAGGAFSAAAETLTYVHEGRLTPAYASSSFDSYQNELSGLDQQLASQDGAPDSQTIHQLLALYNSAMSVINQPCLNNTCSWHEQVVKLENASKAFLKAGGQ